MSTLKQKSKEYIELLNREMEKLLESDNSLYDSMRYSVFAGGKRLRPLLMFSVAEILNIDKERVVPFAIAVEFIHTYSLIHDDLPAMDNDDLRRGKPTNHIVYGEDMAILAGDGLLNFSIEILLSHCLKNFDKKNIEATKLLFDSSGVNGMILGQSLDIKNEKNNKLLDIDELKEINELKTGKLIEASILIPAVLAGVSTDLENIFYEVAKKLGLAYQIKDDLLDICGNDIGKPTGSDEKNCKNTYPTILGMTKTKNIYCKLTEDMYNLLEKVCKEEDFLYLLIKEILNREI